jgi:hypothetical protein
MWFVTVPSPPRAKPGVSTGRGVPGKSDRDETPTARPARDVQSTMLTELLGFLDELLSYLESVRDVSGEDGKPARRSSEMKRLTQKTRALRDAVSAERQKH